MDAPKLLDTVSECPLYAALIKDASEQLEKEGSLAVVALRVAPPSASSSISLDEEKHNDFIGQIGRACRDFAAERLAPPWALGVNQYAGDRFVFLFSRLKDGSAPASPQLRKFAGELRERVSQNAEAWTGVDRIQTQPGASASRLVSMAVDRALASIWEEVIYPEYERQENDLKRIIFQNSLHTVFQPIVSLPSEKTVAFEALTRGPAETEYESPDFLFTLSRRSGLILDLDLLCRNLAFANARSLPGDTLLFVNVLAHTMAHHNFLDDRFMEILREAGLSPSRIVFEINEKYPIADYRVFRSNLDSIRKHGFRIAVDDAGEGYSNFRTLFETRPDFIKLDQSLVQHLHDDPIREKVVNVLMDIGKELGSEIIAEGVETKQELDKVLAIGAQYAQGFYFSKPLPLRQFAG